MNEKHLLILDNFPKAAELVNAVLSGKYRLVIYGGAIRGGKSYNTLGALMLLHKLYAGSRSCIIRDNLETLRRNTLPTCDKVFPKNFIRSFNGTTFEWILKNGSKTFFFGENWDKDKDLHRWNGLEVNFIVIDQIEELQEESFEKSLERVGSYVIPFAPVQPDPLIMITVNPAFNWVRKRFYEPYINGTLPPDWLYIPALITDNPFIPQGFIDNLNHLKVINPIKYRQFVLGDWDAREQATDTFYKQFNFDRHVKAIRYNPDLALHISIDENVNPYLPATVWQIEGKEIRQIDELIMRNPQNSVTALCTEFKKRYYNHNAGLFLYGDATSQKADVKLEQGHNLFTLFRKGLYEFNPILRVPGKNPSPMIRGMFLNSILGVEFNGLKISISDTCNISIMDLQKIKEGPDGGKDKRTERAANGMQYQMYGHTSDTMDYFICEAFQSDFRNYQKMDTEFNLYTFGERKAKLDY